MSSYCTACLQNIEPEIRYDGPAQYLCCPNCREQIFAEIKTDTVQASLETINYDPLIIETFVRAPNPPKLLANSVPEVIPFLKIVHTASVDIIPSVSIPIPRPIPPDYIQFQKTLESNLRGLKFDPRVVTGAAFTASQAGSSGFLNTSTSQTSTLPGQSDSQNSFRDGIRASPPPPPRPAPSPEQPVTLAQHFGSKETAHEFFIAFSLISALANPLRIHQNEIRLILQTFASLYEIQAKYLHEHHIDIPVTKPLQESQKRALFPYTAFLHFAAHREPYKSHPDAFFPPHLQALSTPPFPSTVLAFAAIMIYLREKSITKSSIHIYQSILLSDLVPDAVHEGDLESLTTTKEQKAAQQHDLKMKTESREEMLIDPPSAITPKEEGKEEPQHDSLLHSPLPALVPPTQATIFRSTVPKVRGTPQVPTTPPWSERTLPILKDLPDINQLPASPHPILVMQPQHVLGAICYFGFENLRMQYPFIFSLPDYVTAFTSAMKKLKMNVKEELLSWTVGTALIVHPSFMKRKIPALLACAIGIGCTWGANYDRARANRKELRLRERAIVAEEQKNEMLADTSIVVSDDTFVPGPQTGAKSLNSPPYQSNIPNPLILFQHLSATERKHNDVAIASNVSDVTTRKIYKDAEEIMDELTWELNVYAREEEKATIIREEEEFQAALEVAKQQLRNGNIGNFNKLINQRKKK